MKKTLLISSCCLLLAGGGFKKADSTPVNLQTSRNVKQLIADTAPTSPAVQPRVELLNAGAEPKQELRYKPTANAKQSVTITTDMDLVSTVSGQSMPKVKVPRSVMKMDVLVNQVDTNGDIHYQYAYTDADVLADQAVQPEVVNTMRSAIKKMVGFKGTAVIDNRGQVKSSNFDIPDKLDAVSRKLLEQVSGSLSQLSSPVPTEAVGKGAKWRVSTPLNLGGMNLSQSATYELADLKDNVATLNVTMEQQAKSQDLPAPGLPEGATLTIKSFNSQGQGQMIMRLDAAVPTQAKMSIRSNGEINIKGASRGRDTTVGTQVSMQLSLESQLQK